MCRTNLVRRWQVIGESFNQLLNALIRAAPCQRLLRVRFSDSVGCGSNDCKLNRGIFVYPPTCVQTIYSTRWGYATHAHTHTPHSHTTHIYIHTHIYIYIHTARSTTGSHVGKILTVVSIFHCRTTVNILKLYIMLIINRSHGKVYAFIESFMYYKTPGYFLDASGGLCEHMLSQQATVSVRNMSAYGTFHKVCAWNWLIQTNLVIFT